MKHLSRSARFQLIQEAASNLQTDAETLRDELQEWLDNMPENLQSGSKADELNDAISALDEVIEAFETIAGADVSFPSMF